MKQIVAHIPARTIKSNGKTFEYPAREDSFTCDEAGNWTNAIRGRLTDADVIDICRNASNWDEIRATHFPMAGFHA